MSPKHVIVTAIQTIANTMKKLTITDYPLIFTEDTRVVVFAKIAKIIRRASIVINVSPNISGHMENLGMKQMSVHVSSTEVHLSIDYVMGI